MRANNLVTPAQQPTIERVLAQGEDYGVEASRYIDSALYDMLRGLTPTTMGGPLADADVAAATVTARTRAIDRFTLTWAVDKATAAPVIAATAIGQTHALLATGKTVGSPVLGHP